MARCTPVMARVWERRYWLAPLALAVLLVVFLVQQLWIDSVIVSVLLVGFLGFLALVRGYERRIFDKFNQGREEDAE